jgi:hypothetical protein
VDIRRDEPLLVPHHRLSSINQYIHQTLLVLWGNIEDVDEGHYVVRLRDLDHTPFTSSAALGVHPLQDSVCPKHKHLPLGRPTSENALLRTWVNKG